MDNIATVINYKTDYRIDKEVRSFLEKMNEPQSPPIETLAPAEARRVLSNAQAAVQVDLSGIEVAEKVIEAGGYKVKLHVVRPAGERGILPVFMFIHGGGWVLGDFPTHRRMVRDLVVLSGAAAVFVNYTRTPDAVYPQAVNEIYAATQWVSEHGAEINVDGKRLAVVGNSVGGNMTAVTTLKAKEQGAPLIKFQAMLWPIVDANFDTTSYREFGEERFLTKSLMQWMYDLYLKDLSRRKDIYASPLQASIEQLRGLPPALVQVAENDILRDEGEAYARKLSEAGVPVTCVRYNGMIHDFGLLNGLAGIPAVHSLFLHTASELKNHLW